VIDRGVVRDTETRAVVEEDALAAPECAGFIEPSGASGMMAVTNGCSWHWRHCSRPATASWENRLTWRVVGAGSGRQGGLLEQRSPGAAAIRLDDCPGML
jgi:hypothetical protein